MNKIAIIYSSRMNYTKKYAQWIAEELNCDIFHCKPTLKELLPYDYIIYGGGYYNGTINGLDYFINLVNCLPKKFVLFFTGVSNLTQEEIVATSKNFLGDNYGKIEKIFYFRGGLNYKKLNPLSKAVFVRFKKSPQNFNSEQKYILNHLDTEFNFSNKTFISPLLQYFN
ncbi:MAG: flavodoxin domain-containing protein [Clostridia bacterium]